MLSVGKSYKLKTFRKSNVFGLVLGFSKSGNVLMALVSKLETQNCSRLKLSNGYFVYPAIQGTISRDSASARSELPGQFEFSSASELGVISNWPAMTGAEKEVVSSDFDRLYLGDLSAEFTDGFLQELQEFSDLSHGNRLSMEIGTQLHHSLMSKIILGESNSPFTVAKSTNAALFASRTLSQDIIKAGSIKTNDLNRFLLRRAVELKSGAQKSSKSANVSEFSAYFDFMKHFGLPSMAIALPLSENSTKNVKRVMGPLTLNLQTTSLN